MFTRSSSLCVEQYVLQMWNPSNRCSLTHLVLSLCLPLVLILSSFSHLEGFCICRDIMQHLSTWKKKKDNYLSYLSIHHLVVPTFRCCNRLVESTDIRVSLCKSVHERDRDITDHWCVSAFRCLFQEHLEVIRSQIKEQFTLTHWLLSPPCQGKLRLSFHHQAVIEKLLFIEVFMDFLWL